VEPYAAGACSASDFIWKNAIAINSAATHIRMKPVPKAIVRNAPMSSNRPPVENNPTLAFVERVFSDRLAKKPATMAKTHRITSTKNTAPITDATSLPVMFAVCGVLPEIDAAKFDQLPFQDG